jgi:hypothetical protein
MALGSADPMGELLRRTILELEATKAKVAELERIHHPDHGVSSHLSLDDHLLEEFDCMCDSKFPRTNGNITSEAASAALNINAPSAADFLPNSTEPVKK